MAEEWHKADNKPHIVLGVILFHGLDVVGKRSVAGADGVEDMREDQRDSPSAKVKKRNDSVLTAADEFISWTNGATCTVSVINWGNGTAEVRYDLEKGGTTHFQYYKNIAVDADVFFRLKGDAGTDITFAE